MIPKAATMSLLPKTVVLPNEAINFSGKTVGKKRIIDLGLTNDIVAKKLLVIYNSILHK